MSTLPMTPQHTNPQPIEAALDADLRLSKAALQRAAQRARDLALQTGTAIVVSHHGVLELLNGAPPAHPSLAPAAHEPPAPYATQP